jgi:hypothetical protein
MTLQANQPTWVTIEHDDTAYSVEWAEWTEVIEVCLQRDKLQGGFRVLAYNAQEQQMLWDEGDPGQPDFRLSHRPWATGHRGALLEVTARLRRLGYEGQARWAEDGADSEALIRTFRKTA